MTSLPGSLQKRLHAIHPREILLYFFLYWAVAVGARTTSRSSPAKVGDLAILALMDLVVSDGQSENRWPQCILFNSEPAEVAVSCLLPEACRLPSFLVRSIQTVFLKAHHVCLLAASVCLLSSFLKSQSQEIRGINSQGCIKY